MSHNQEQMTRIGLYGVAPFMAAAVVMWLSPFIVPQWIALNVHSLILAYGGVIAAFLAGAGMNASGRFGPSVIAMLLSWFAIWPSGLLTFSVPASWRYLLLAGIFLWLMKRDLAAAAGGNYPAWYGALRMRLTVWTCAALIVIASRLIIWGYY